MRFIPKIDDTCIACIFTPYALSISHWIPHKNKTLLSDYVRIPLSNGELEHMTLCNPTAIQQHLRYFIDRNNAQHALTLYALNGPSVDEAIQSVSTRGAESCHLYHHNDCPIEYACALHPAILAQYQLLAIRLRIHLSMITTPFIAMLKLYQSVYGSAFRHTQLSQDLRSHRHCIEDTFADDLILRMVQVNQNVTIDLAKEQFFLLSSLGLFYLRR